MRKLIKLPHDRNFKLKSNNVKFAYFITKLFNIDKFFFLKSLQSFKGLPHRQEEIYMKNKIRCINDSKATSFDASSKALQNYKNILSSKNFLLCI